MPQQDHLTARLVVDDDFEVAPVTVTFEPLFDDPGTVDLSGINWIVVGTMTGAQSSALICLLALSAIASRSIATNLRTEAATE